MKAYIAFSGGKDSQACLIWAVLNFSQKVEAIFCDTGNEHELTYEHVKKICAMLGVTLHIVRNKKYKDFGDMARKKKRFPSTKARFCTEKLKVEPQVDFILAQKEDCLIIQGIRKDESTARTKMDSECSFFKDWIAPYSYNKRGKPVYMSYRRKEVLAHAGAYTTAVLRPIFDWSAQETIDYILQHGQKPNQLYYLNAVAIGRGLTIDDLARMSYEKVVAKRGVVKDGDPAK